MANPILVSVAPYHIISYVPLSQMASDVVERGTMRCFVDACFGLSLQGHSYGTLLGTSFFHASPPPPALTATAVDVANGHVQSFVNGPVLYKSIDRPAFSAAQTNLFPIYFSIQTVIPIVLALTFPGNTLNGVPSGISGLLHDSSKWDSLVPIAAMFVTGLANLAVIGPATTKTMKERRGQVKRDGKEWYAEGPHSDEMQALNKRFGMLHGVSSLVNLTTFVSAVTYGFTLGARIQSIADRVA
ncbi:hypothetical protein JDV02_000762 [Purpureocillium takamizusanense]|uniref:TMEM205-like domain-containing protein n=1 Tax=Purpureocillium takamizusanense TaxID=2060973 RepID=A0A9Q8V6R0_9HYPO|nr:uncharacterized protein JDV02_000762 [Purpureocillium takamizusanense]UNI14089.1 hypothetical protein JDV02_000762 [Purpureocillium takamizusanense]